MFKINSRLVDALVICFALAFAMGLGNAFNFLMSMIANKY